MPTTDVMDQTETDIRERILITTERLFREIGYQKTTVADIAPVAPGHGSDPLHGRHWPCAKYRPEV